MWNPEAHPPSSGHWWQAIRCGTVALAGIIKNALPQLWRFFAHLWSKSDTSTMGTYSSPLYECVSFNSCFVYLTFFSQNLSLVSQFRHLGPDSNVTRGHLWFSLFIGYCWTLQSVSFKVYSLMRLNRILHWIIHQSRWPTFQCHLRWSLII